jgi:2-oxo-4-hydroxy-4-carboxy--5-ureidoimidazoline (OHCU) decarboxylase
VRDLPRQLSVHELAELFEGRTRFVEHLAGLEDPLGHAREAAAALSDEEKKEVLDAHPQIAGTRLGEKKGRMSARSAAEQGTDEAPELDELNRRYEEKFGFRFVVFVNRRPKSQIVPILRERLERTRKQELATALDELVSIAEDRWRRQS